MLWLPNTHCHPRLHLNSRLMLPTAYLIFPLGCPMGPIYLTCPKYNSYFPSSGTTTFPSQEIALHSSSGLGPKTWNYPSLSFFLFHTLYPNHRRCSELYHHNISIIQPLLTTSASTISHLGHHHLSPVLLQ